MTVSSTEPDTPKSTITEEISEIEIKKRFIVCDKGVSNDGRRYWIYVAIEPARYTEFMKVAKSGSVIDYRDYGKVLRYGYDDEVPQHVKDEMRQKYGCEANIVDGLRKKNAIVEAALQINKNSGNNERISDIVAKLKNKPAN